MSDAKHVFQSLAVNGAIAAAKGVAALVTGSGAMLAEALHSASDCGNQLLLLLGLKEARKPPDAEHPLGYGRSLYFWSFMVALLLFTGGGVFSIYEGIHKVLEPEPIDHVGLGLGILLFSLVLEGASTFSNIRELNRRRGTTGFFRFLRQTKDSDLVVVFGENAAASLGLAFAMGALGMAWFTHDSRWDALGSILIGVVLIAVAIFLATEVHALLVGEAADPATERAVREVVGQHADVVKLLRIITVQQGPGEVLLALKIAMRDGMHTTQIAESINALERAIKVRSPEIRWSFVEPDLIDSEEAD